jgi:cyanophycinase
MAEAEAGALLIIGGAEDKQGECAILREFVALAGGARARVVVIAVASEQQTNLSNVYLDVFRRLGVEDARTLGVAHRERANAPSAVESIERATGVFFTGGSQLRITRLLGGTLLDRVLHRRHDAGLVLAGTSAGAAMMPGVMIAGGVEPVTSLRAGAVELAPGMEFASGVIIDQHFEERGRLRRLLAAVAQHPRDLGVGIDEDTAVVVRGGKFRVIGAGAATVVDASEMTHTNLASVERNALLAVSGVRIHVLPAGYGFDLHDRAVVLPPEERLAAEARS